ncbi:hypothetical protein U1Q18_012499 [Sarracenia purpurea var. burkii]
MAARGSNEGRRCRTVLRGCFRSVRLAVLGLWFALLGNGIRAAQREEKRCSTTCRSSSAQDDSKPLVGNRSLTFEGVGLSTSVLQRTPYSATAVSQPPP